MQASFLGPMARNRDPGCFLSDSITWHVPLRWIHPAFHPTHLLGQVHRAASPQHKRDAQSPSPPPEEATHSCKFSHRKRTLCRPCQVVIFFSSMPSWPLFHFRMVPARPPPYSLLSQAKVEGQKEDKPKPCRAAAQPPPGSTLVPFA